MAYLLESCFIEETGGLRIVKFLPSACCRIALHFAQSAELGDTKMVVLRTTAPFRSQYLVIRYKKDAAFPESFFFTNEVNGDTIRIL